MKLLISLMTVLVFQNAFAQATSGVATLEKSQSSEWATFQVHGNAAKELYRMLQIQVELGGIKRGPGITCVKTTNNSYYCSMSVNPQGDVEGDGISSISN